MPTAVTTPPADGAALTTPPSTASPSNFDTRADAFFGALPTFQTDQNALKANVFANATSAFNNATEVLANTNAVAANTALAALYAGAIAWVSGTTYAIGDRRTSPANGLVYRRTTAGAGTTDPSADGTNWQIVQVSPPVVIVSGTTQTAVAGTHYVLTNVAATTVTLPASPAAGDRVWITVINALATNVVARNAQTIMGLAEDMTVDNKNAFISLQFLNSSWRLVE